MLRAFMRSPLPNTLAVVVLVALIVSWITSLVLAMRDKPLDTRKGWYAWAPAAFALLGIPGLIDLLQTSGIALAFVVIIVLVFLAVIVVPAVRGRMQNEIGRDWFDWAILISAVGGLAVVTYLTFVEARGGPVACGPSGGCDTVQHSKYSVLFGILPVGVLGLAGYVGIVVAWLVWQFGPESLKKLSLLALWGMCVFGVLFSIYLTFLEPFVIGATCMWCITSAVLMIVLLLLATPAAQQALAVGEDE